MAEITHKGAWIQWDSLDARDKRLFAISMVATIPFGMVIGIPVGEWAYQLGHYLSSDGAPADTRHYAELVESAAYRYGVLAALICAAISAVAWWRFSIHQDELFNRIQNYAIGRAGAWSVAGATAWWMLALGGWTGPLLAGPFVLASFALLLAFWFYAVHKWA